MTDITTPGVQKIRLERAKRDAKEKGEAKAAAQRDHDSWAPMRSAGFRVMSYLDRQMGPRPVERITITRWEAAALAAALGEIQTLEGPVMPPQSALQYEDGPPVGWVAKYRGVRVVFEGNEPSRYQLLDLDWSQVCPGEKQP